MRLKILSSTNEHLSDFHYDFVESSLNKMIQVRGNRNVTEWVITQLVYLDLDKKIPKDFVLKPTEQSIIANPKLEGYRMFIYFNKKKDDE